MNKKKLCASLFIFTAILSSFAHSHEDDDPLLATLMLDKLEKSGEQTTLELNAWLGKDINKLWLKTDIERDKGETEHAEVQALFSHAFSAYWDLQTGVRRDVKPSPSHTWGAIGVQGLAPYFFELEATAFIGQAGRTAGRITADYDFLFTQRLILSPEIELNFYGQNDAATKTGSGLSSANTGVRLRYEIRREFAPYIGVNWNKKFGNTADFTKAAKEPVSDSEWVVGIRAWL